LDRLSNRPARPGFDGFGAPFVHVSLALAVELAASAFGATTL
jgi:hypothetical protein